jgi:drug/metabolite transporter superfamily protein YnfA
MKVAGWLYCAASTTVLRVLASGGTLYIILAISWPGVIR